MLSVHMYIYSMHVFCIFIYTQYTLYVYLSCQCHTCERPTRSKDKTIPKKASQSLSDAVLLPIEYPHSLLQLCRYNINVLHSHTYMYLKLDSITEVIFII